MDLPHINSAVKQPNNNQTAPTALNNPQHSLFHRALRFVGIQPTCRVDLELQQEHMTGPSRFSLSKSSKPTLNTVLESWISQAEEVEQPGRRRVAKLMKESGALLKNSQIVIRGLFGFGGTLDIFGWIDLISLPENLTVDCDLSLIGCEGLKSLPENLTVGGNLILRGCANFRPSVPESLSCRKLDMSDMYLNQVPENIEKVQKLHRVNLNMNEINALPDRLGQLPKGTELFVELNPIPAAEIRRFRAAYPHIILRANGHPLPNTVSKP